MLGLVANCRHLGRVGCANVQIGAATERQPFGVQRDSLVDAAPKRRAHRVAPEDPARQRRCLRHGKQWKRKAKAVSLPQKRKAEAVPSPRKQWKHKAKAASYMWGHHGPNGLVLLVGLP